MPPKVHGLVNVPRKFGAMSSRQAWWGAVSTRSCREGGFVSDS
jgi:hypothetical protein